MTEHVSALARSAEQGTAVWWSRGSIVVVKLEADESGGTFSLAEQHCPPGYETPMHVHNDHDEILMANDGRFAVYYGDERVEAGPGEFVYLPKGVEHGFRSLETEPARIHVLFEPGLERGFLEAGVPTDVPTDGLPSPPPELADAEKLIDVDRVYDTEIVEPLPEE